jgi:tetratricopeptide (TPR) repeat protein
MELQEAPPDESIAVFEKAVRLDGNNAEALLALGRSIRASDPRRALTLFDRAAELEEEDVEVRRAAAALLAAGGLFEEAEERYRQALETHPFNGEIAFDWARLRNARALPADQTEKLLERAIRFGAQRPARDLLAEIQADAGTVEAPAGDRGETDSSG